MGRPQSFDRDAVVRAARDLFWDRGFEEVSVPDLEAATGLSRSSIYNAFGSKRGLFDAAVDNYLVEVVRPLLGALQEEVVPPDELLDYLDRLRVAISRPGPGEVGAGAGDGCLLLNTAFAPIVRDAHLAHIVASYRLELRAAIGRGVGACRPDLDEASRDTLAEVLTAMVVEALVLVRVSPPQAVHVLDAARHVLLDVDWDSSGPSRFDRSSSHGPEAGDPRKF